MSISKVTSVALAIFMGLSPFSIQATESFELFEETSSLSDTKSVEDEQFITFLDDYFFDVCQSNYLLCHHYLENPQAYGIDLTQCEVSLGSFSNEENSDQILLNTLRQMDASSLSPTYRQIYNNLLQTYSLSAVLSNPRFELLGNIWSSTNGIPFELVTFFSEYKLNSKEDIPYLIALIQDVPRYIEDGLAYSKKQAETGNFSIDLDATLKQCDTILKSKDNSPITKEIFTKIEGFHLSQEEENQLKDQINQAMSQSFFPAYETIKSGLLSLKDQNRPLKGLASFENGKTYYEVLLQQVCGDQVNPDSLQNQLWNLLVQSLELYKQRYGNLPEEVNDVQTSFTSLDQILPFLEEHYAELFPNVGKMSYQMRPLSLEESQDGIMAYFVIPSIDNSKPYQMRYNGQYGDSPSSLSLFSTFAHEGIPGHMYQAQYNKENFIHPIQHLVANSSFVEGFANYAENVSLSFLDLDANELNKYYLLNQYSSYVTLFMDMQIHYEGLSQEQFASMWGEGTAELYQYLAQNPGQFFPYYYGSLRILSLKEMAQNALGIFYDEVDFHDALLKAGSVRFPIVEENIKDYIEKATLQNQEEPLEEGKIGLYRLYNRRTGEHFYTTSRKECDSVRHQTLWKYEGRSWVAPSTSEIPVYRLSNPNAKNEHHYTADVKEYENLAKLGWNPEGVAWYSLKESDYPLYRLYNPNAKTGTHHYTLDLTEKEALIQAGWKDEGIAFYALEPIVK